MTPSLSLSTKSVRISRYHRQSTALKCQTGRFLSLSLSENLFQIFEFHLLAESPQFQSKALPACQLFQFLFQLFSISFKLSSNSTASYPECFWGCDLLSLFFLSKSAQFFTLLFRQHSNAWCAHCVESTISCFSAYSNSVLQSLY